jgi:hypothetical protein
MGFMFRKSKKFGPLRVTASKRGLSTSIGVPGARLTKGPNGKRATLSVPGSGLRWTKPIRRR